MFLNYLKSITTFQRSPYVAFSKCDGAKIDPWQDYKATLYSCFVTVNIYILSLWNSD